MVSAGVLAGAAILAGALCWSDGRRWLGSSRVLGRLGRRAAGTPVVPTPVGRALTRAGLEHDHGAIFYGWLAALALAVATTTVARGGPVLVAVTLLAPPGAVVGLRSRAARIRTRRLPTALDTIAGGLRGGSSLRHAVRDAGSIGGPLGREFTHIAHQAEAGRGLAEAVTEWAGRAEDTPSRLAAAALAVASEIGGPGATAIDGAAASLRARAAADDEVSALSVQARLSAVVLTVTPVGFAFLLTTLDPTSARFLFGTTTGWACITVGLLLDAAGALWMSRLVRTSR